MHSLIPAFYALATLGVFSVGVLFGAAIVEGAENKHHNRPPLMELAEGHDR